MSISNLLASNNYDLKIGEVTILDLDTGNLNTDNFTVGGIQPKGSILASDGVSMKNLTVGSDGLVLTANSAASSGVSWQQGSDPSSAAYGQIYREASHSREVVNTTFGSWEPFDPTTVLGDVDLFDSPANSVLRYTGTDTITVKVTANMDIEVSGPQNNDFIFAFVVDGVRTLVGSSGTSLSNGREPTNLTMSLITTVTGGTTFSIEVLKDSDSSGNLEVIAYSLFVNTFEGIGSGNADTNIYNTSGTLTGTRVIDCSSNGITFQSAAPFRVSGTLTDITTTQFTLNGSAPQGAIVCGDGTTLTTAPTPSLNGQVLIADNTQVNGIRWGTAPAGNNFYDNSGTIPASTLRIVSAGDGASQIRFDPAVNFQGVLQKSGSAVQGSLLKADGSSYDNFVRGNALQYLRVNAAGTDLEYGDLPSGPNTNIYDNNGTIPASTLRIVSAGDGASQIRFDPAVNFQGVLQKSGSAPTGSILKGDGSTYDNFVRGNAVQYLRVNSLGTDIEWADLLTDGYFGSLNFENFATPYSLSLPVQGTFYEVNPISYTFTQNAPNAGQNNGGIDWVVSSAPAKFSFTITLDSTTTDNYRIQLRRSGTTILQTCVASFSAANKPITVNGSIALTITSAGPISIYVANMTSAGTTVNILQSNLNLIALKTYG
jgi:hypothetical protein